MKKILFVVLVLSSFTVAGAAFAGTGCDYRFNFNGDTYGPDDAQNVENAMKNNGFNLVADSDTSAPYLSVTYDNADPLDLGLIGRNWVSAYQNDPELSCDGPGADGNWRHYDCILINQEEKSSLFEGPKGTLKDLISDGKLPSCQTIQAAHDQCVIDYEKNCK